MNSQFNLNETMHITDFVQHSYTSKAEMEHIQTSDKNNLIEVIWNRVHQMVWRTIQENWN